MVSLRQVLVRSALLLLLAAMLSNCGGLLYYDAPSYEYDRPYGVYHPVKKGQTLYSIAKGYGVSVAELQRVNGLWDPASMDEGMFLWIPRADRLVYVAPTVEGTPGVSKSRPRKTKSKSKTKTASVKKKLLWPVKGGVLTSRFGTRSGRNHHGIDIGARRGTPIRAAHGGTVEFSGWGPTGYGLMIIIKHPGRLTTVYAHNMRNLVRKGNKVRRGQMIARVGKTGRASGPHVHFEVRNDTHPKNPLLYLKK